MGSMIKKVILWAAGIAAVLALGVWIWGGGVEKFGEEASLPDELSEDVAIPVISEKGESEILAALPEGLTLNAKTNVSQSFSAAYPEAAVRQATIVFESSKTPQENYSFYTKWAKDNKWEIINKAEEGPIYFLYLSKEGEDMNIVMAPRDPPAGGGSDINISHAKF